MSKKSQASSSVVELTCPRRWEELSEKQLSRVLRLVHCCRDSEHIKLRALCMLTGLRVVRRVPGGWHCRLKRQHFFLRTWQFDSMALQLGWLDTSDGIPVRMGCVGSRRCVCDSRLHGLSFGDYLMAERQYQLFLLHRQPRFLKQLAGILYRIDASTSRKRHISKLRMMLSPLRPWHLTATFLWFMNCKKVLAKEFPWFFRPAGEQADDSYDLIAQYNVQLRALSGGDITKEQIILQMDCWRALTELNAKARETEQHRIEMQRIKNRNC